MDAAEIERAYDPFVAAVAGGGGRPPAPAHGGGAPMVAAHVALNNDHWTRAARDVLAGGPSAYDNEAAVDADVLRRHLDGVGGTEALLADLRRSVGDLAAVYDELGDLRGTVIPVRIVSDGVVVRDQPAAVGDMIVGNATYHLQMHYEQLLALRPGDSG
jgi:hypothetical protein